jgi:hypothetical protein
MPVRPNGRTRSIAATGKVITPHIMATAGCHNTLPAAKSLEWAIGDRDRGIEG